NKGPEASFRRNTRRCHTERRSRQRARIHPGVLVQPEMERRRFPLVSVPPSGGGFQGIDTTTRLSLSMVAFPQSPLGFARQDHCSSTTSIRLKFRVARQSGAIRTEHMYEMATSRLHGFVKRYGLVRDDRDEATPVMVPFRRSPARLFPVLPHHRLGVLPLGSP